MDNLYQIFVVKDHYLLGILDMIHDILFVVIKHTEVIIPYWILNLELKILFNANAEIFHDDFIFIVVWII